MECRPYALDKARISKDLSKARGVGFGPAWPQQAKRDARYAHLMTGADSKAAGAIDAVLG
jgi:hypothetical protein